MGHGQNIQCLSISQIRSFAPHVIADRALDIPTNVHGFLRSLEGPIYEQLGGRRDWKDWAGSRLLQVVYNSSSFFVPLQESYRAATYQALFSTSCSAACYHEHSSKNTHLGSDVHVPSVFNALKASSPSLTWFLPTTEIHRVQTNVRSRRQTADGITQHQRRPGMHT